MNTWRTLYLKELKDHRGVFLFLVIVTLCLDLYALIQVYQIMGRTSFSALDVVFYPVLAILSYGAVFLLPFILAHSFSTESKAGTHYLLFSLPVRRSAIVLCKFLAVLSVGVVLFVLTTGTLHLLYLKMRVLLDSNPGLAGGVATIRGTDMWLTLGNGYFSILLLFLGLVSAMEGLKFACKRFRGLVVMVFFIGSLFLFNLLRGPGMELLGLASREGWMLGPELQAQREISLESVVYSALACVVLLGLGLWLFEKHAEV
mgnify:CR=1 FL=1